ncbi:MAG: segregation/condensation protein A [Bacteroidetes bacterium QS_8_64_10]|jgi:segregation and condensation protein A|nr:MAG: segregation/condensation protein A [Bacteroidetes bacterium QS_8_64_10]
MYQVQLQDFEGPLDLLLFFIKRDELDVFNIPIAEVTDEFLAYVRAMQEIDLDGVGDFIYMAAVLISIKAEMLLPSDDDEAGDEEAVDPRRELARRLLEYKRFKEAANDLERHQERRLQKHTRGAASSQEKHYETERELDLDASVYDLATALRGVLTTLPEPDPVHAVERESYSVEQQQTYVLERVLEAQTVSFEDLVRERSRPFVIATFLAVLEMARQRLVTISIAASNQDFYLLRPDAEAE